MGRARNSAAFLFALTTLRVASAGAQVQAGDATPRRMRIPSAVISPGQFIYQTTLERNAGTTVLGTRTIAVSQASYAGSPAWLLLETRAGDGIPAADSLFAGIADLHPIHWNSTLGGARLAVLAALNIADEYHLLKRRMDGGSSDSSKRTRQLLSALDEVLLDKRLKG